jgi:hypothetical protein
VTRCSERDRRHLVVTTVNDVDLDALLDWRSDPRRARGPRPLDRELGVLDILIVALELAQYLPQPHVDFRHPVPEIARRAHTQDDVLAVGVGQEVAAPLGRAGDLVAEKATRRRTLGAEIICWKLSAAPQIIGTR